MNFTKFLMGQMMLMDKAGEGSGGGGGGSSSGGQGQQAPATVTLTKEQFDAIMAKLPKEQGSGSQGGQGQGSGQEDPSLADKARREREENEKRSKYEKGLEGAINFNVASKDFLKSNASLLPKNIEGIFAQAEKENYGNAIEKANAIKVGVVSEFFAVQGNHDLLTASQKIELDEFLKLTKNGKQDRIESIYSMIFEPTLETLRKIEKAKQVHQNGSDQSDAEKQLADRMMKLSKKHYLGEKDA